MSVKNKLKTMTSALSNRWNLSSVLGMMFGGKRDLYKVFGYEPNPKFEHYFARYQRQDIAKRIVNGFADATWKNPPVVKASEAFTSAWKVLEAKHNLWGELTRVDRMSGIGQYAVLLLGMSDSSKLEMPVVKKEGTKLLYLQPYMQCDAAIIELEDDVTNERFGQPRMYEISLADPMKLVNTVASNVNTAVKADIKVKVHHSRVLHIAEDAMVNNFIGTPRLQSVYNLLDDLLKVAGGTAETYWLTSNRGMQVDIDKEAEMSEGDAEALADEVEEYSNDLRRTIRTRGVKITNLGANTPDPKNTFNMIISLIAAATGYPQRILLGAEAGQLASDQDRANWADRVKERRNVFAEPYVLKPLITKLAAAGILPQEDETKVDFQWPATFELTPLENAQQMAQRARAIINLSKHFVDGDPLCTKEEAREIVGLSATPSQGQIPARTLSPSAKEQGNVPGQGNSDTQDNTENGTRQEIISESTP